MSLRDDLIQSRYLLDGETEEQMWRRVSNFVTETDEDADLCFKYLMNGEIIFNSPFFDKQASERRKLYDREGIPYFLEV